MEENQTFDINVTRKTIFIIDLYLHTLFILFKQTMLHYK